LVGTVHLGHIGLVEEITSSSQNGGWDSCIAGGEASGWKPLVGENLRELAQGEGSQLGRGRCTFDYVILHKTKIIGPKKGRRSRRIETQFEP